MTFSKKPLMIFVAMLAVTTALWAQRPGGMNPFGGMPSFGLQNPTLGSGSEYQMTSKGKDMDVAIVILGKENVGGETGYWMEQRIISQETGGGEMVMKELVVSSAGAAGIKRMIMQQPGRPPMEMPGMMMNMMQQHQAAPMTTKGEGGPGGAGEMVGTESVTVPAGTFSCQHYRKQDQRGTTDLWISTQVTPYAMVKMTGPDVTMSLKKVLANESTHIKGEPQQMQFPGMPQ